MFKILAPVLRCVSRSKSNYEENKTMKGAYRTTRRKDQATLLMLVCAALLFTVVTGAASAQTPSGKRVRGYGFVAPGGTAGDGSAFTVHYGGGVEGLVFRGLGVGAELGNVTAVGKDSNLGIFSTNGSYHFGRRGSSRGVSPFVTGGYSLRFGDDEETVSGINLGGGVQYWATERLGMRLEFRDHHFFRGVLNFYGVRLGLAVR
jgi:Outer membrane protein beta-barrel domain